MFFLHYFQFIKHNLRYWNIVKWTKHEHVISYFLPTCQMRSSLSWGVTHRWLAVNYWRFGTAYQSYLKRSNSLVQSSWLLNLEDETDWVSWNVGNY